ncbi:MAG: NAD(P)-binding protein [Sulfurovum sp.]|nr:NAD(P)-binding protein [Sulfurovum sp.]
MSRFIRGFSYNAIMKKEKVLIIGAGLCGLYTAYLLQDDFDVEIIEARERIGGRVHNIAGHDMGPSWIWGHQREILKLIQTLGLVVFEQYTQGLALYDVPDGVQTFSPPQAAKSYRIEGGISALLEAIKEKLHCTIHLGEQVLSISQTKELEVETNKKIYTVSRVISTLPPRLAVKSIVYTPALETAVKNTLENIPTWMGYSAKCVIEYPNAFWREEGLSGFTFSHVGPLSEIHDASTKAKAALFGFVQSNVESANIEKKVLEQLVRLYGVQASEPTHIHFVDWKEEVYTSTEADKKPLSSHPNYGFDLTHFEGKMFFSGTESAMSDGGYLEGALVAALHASEKIKRETENDTNHR